MTATEGYETGSAQDALDGYRGAPQDVPPPADHRLAPADVHAVRFARGTMVHPGYADAEVDAFLTRVADELGRLTAEKAELRDRVHTLEQQLSAVQTQEAPSDQAVRILAIAQQTADSYVAEAEAFSRTTTQQAREAYEEQTRRARENAGAIIQAAQEAAEQIAAGGGSAAGRPAADLSDEELQEQIRYLKAFAQAVRVQLRAYLEALLSDVESEWGSADPSALPQAPIRAAAQRSDRGASATRLHAEHEPNVADVVPAQDPGQSAGQDSAGPRVAGARR
jgi:DivIVA domain-containing protein